MSETDRANAEADADHGQDDHGHGSAPESLGPIDLTTWAYALAGSILALLVVVALYVARGA